MSTTQEEFQKWRDTEIGKLFEAYSAATGNAWVIDQTSNSTARMREAWKRQERAQKAFLDKLTELTGIEHPYKER